VSEPTPSPSIDLAAIRRRLEGAHGPALWRSLDELAQAPEFAEFLEHEFPRQAAAIHTAVDRRDFLKLMSASLGLAGLSACTKQPEELIVPYVRQPEGLVLGLATSYATAMPLGGYGVGLLAESHEYRPTKVEGNPDHPSSLGGTDASIQGSVLGLYDPDRSKTILSAGQIRPWSAFLDAVTAMRTGQAAKGGAGLRILTGTVTSPTLAAQLGELLRQMPQARWCQWEADGRDTVRAGARLAFGGDTPPQAVYDFDKATVGLILDADVGQEGPGRLRYARDIARARRVERGDRKLRLYAIESFPSPTGSVAEHRLPVRSSDVEALARAIAAAAGLRVRPIDAPVVKQHQAFVKAVGADLRRAGSSAVVVAGHGQPAAVHALAHALNEALGAVGTTVRLSEPVEAGPTDELASLRELVAEMRGGKVDCLVMLGVNPVLTAPVDLEFGKALEQVPLRLHLGLYNDETATLCHWHVPETHYLESWSDVRGHDGVVTILQPLIAPLYDGRTAHEVVAAVAGTSGRSSYELVRDHWKTVRATADDATWAQWLQDGIVPDTAAAPVDVRVRGDWDTTPLPAALPPDQLELIFRQDPYLHDGRFANNGWLQELPKPLTKITWANPVFLAPATAERLGVQNKQVVELAVDGRSVRGPVWIVPGQARGSVVVHFGQGRRHGGELARGHGFDAFALRTMAGLHVAAGATVTPTGDITAVACTQDHQSMEGRPLVRRGTLGQWRAHPDFAQHETHVPTADESMFPPWEYSGHTWGMAIDLTACTGCMACVAACVAENNIAVVGKEQILRGREMHWLRVDRYFGGSLDAPEIFAQPVPCMQCENAPCEVVCPVNATVHSSEGLNDMVYNRCVGTRYCSNNCPYKVRRFNYFLFQDWQTETFKMARNPDVTVRSRGVMEKCTYCVQRIEEVRARAKREQRPIKDGEIVTACQQACPSEAIVFGDLNDPQSRVAALRKDPRSYNLLAELNTRPRTTYLAAVTNPNPDLAKEA